MTTKNKYTYMNFSADPVIVLQNIYNNFLNMQNDISSLTLTHTDIQNCLAQIQEAIKECQSSKSE